MSRPSPRPTRTQLTASQRALSWPQPRDVPPPGPPRIRARPTADPAARSPPRGHRRRSPRRRRSARHVAPACRAGRSTKARLLGRPNTRRPTPRWGTHGRRAIAVPSAMQGPRRGAWRRRLAQNRQPRTRRLPQWHQQPPGDVAHLEGRRQSGSVRSSQAFATRCREQQHGSARAPAIRPREARRLPNRRCPSDRLGADCR
jgi:hypothetical protein